MQLGVTFHPTYPGFFLRPPQSVNHPRNWRISRHEENLANRAAWRTRVAEPVNVLLVSTPPV
eukprot:767949-Hanusia_phi.AAC.6